MNSNRNILAKVPTETPEGILAETPAVNRNYKDSLIRMVFQTKESLLSLYNAVNGTQHTTAEELEIVTLENALYMNFKNDTAFILDLYLNIYEHQSTYNPNMPLRNLIYVAKEYEKLIDNKSLYASKLVGIPAPKFVVFYNGISEQAECQILKLSDSFTPATNEPELELKVTMLNINAGKNEDLKRQCRLLQEYMLYVDRVRTYAKSMKIKDAVERAVTECIREGILADLLTKCRREAIAVSIFEYDEEKELELYKKAERDVGFQEGQQAGLQKGLQEGLQAGRTEGELINLISLVRKKKEKNQTSTKIAEDLMDETGIVNAIYDLLEMDASMTDDMICSKIKK